MEPRAENRVNVLRWDACIKIWSRKPSQCIEIGDACIKIWSRKPSQCIKIGKACIKIGDACIKIGNSVR